MSQEGGSEQRTVAELLAKYGNSGESAPRRRRRKPEDGSDTAPQAIIERVMSDSGPLPPITEDQPPHERVSHRQGRATPPPKQPPQGRQPAPDLRQSNPDLRRPQQPVQPPEPQRPLPDAGRLARPVAPSRPVSQPQRGEGHTEQFPRVPDSPDHGEPPSALGGPGPRRPLLPTRAPGAGPVRRPSDPPQRLPESPSTSQRMPQPQPSQQLPKPVLPLPKPQPSQQLPAQPSQQMPKPVLPQPSQQLPLPAQQLPKLPQPSQQMPKPLVKPQPGFPPAPARSPEFGGDPSATAINQGGPPPEFLDKVDGFDDRAKDRFADYRARDDDFDDFDDFDDVKGARDRGDRLDLDDRDDDDDLDADDAEETSAGREWLIMAGQLAVGVVGGAAVWLAFNWLWGFLPAAALIGAVVVIVGMVLIVRKIRRAEDLQTTVLAVLVGLVVTVSPAVLLLLGR